MFRVSVEDWKNLPSNITPYIQEISNLISGEDIDPFLEALSTLSAPEMLLRDLIEEMAVKGNKDSQAAYMERMTENLFSKNSFSDMRNAFAVKHKQSWTSLVGKISKVISNLMLLGIIFRSTNLQFHMPPNCRSTLVFSFEHYISILNEGPIKPNPKFPFCGNSIIHCAGRLEKEGRGTAKISREIESG